MTAFLLSSVFLIICFSFMGFLAGKNVREGNDFSVGGHRATTMGVSGILLGALVGGASTVGTVQMAYSYGLSAFWFTLGGGIGCLILGLWFASPLRASGLQTIPEFLVKRYGKKTGFVCLFASALGTFISVVAQFLAGIALLQGVFPLTTGQATLLTGFFVLLFIGIGGIKSYSLLGKAKLLLLYLVLAVCALVAFQKGGSPLFLVRKLSGSSFLSLFGRGVTQDLSAGLSLIVGVFCTQIYIQAIFAASDTQTARKGALLSAALMPPLGLLGIWIGLFLKTSGVQIEPSRALAYFIFHFFPKTIAGLLWGGIFITVLGCTAGLVLGITTNITRDLLPDCFPATKKPLFSQSLFLYRIVLFFVVGLAALCGMLGEGSMILQWSYLSMGLRGAGTFLPLVVGILWPKLIEARFAFLSSASGVLAILLWPMLGIGGDPLFVGIGVSALCVFMGILWPSRTDLP